MTEESVSLKGEIGDRRCHCCRGSMSKGTAPAAAVSLACWLQEPPERTKT